ncbi:retrotransposon protein [Cucumis melo var. makuwa]|uniref:Retrotransposon protein n=1 Tax=Cucumis melo var. makuwa TaxID=1194695 RepID=A0A5D3BCC8_CUCMM|nr:retrotransposon protein [Cucumis melo var. makuwa]
MSSPVWKDPRRTRRFYVMPFHEKMDYKCQRILLSVRCGLSKRGGASRPVQRLAVPFARVAWCWKYANKCKGVLQHEYVNLKLCFETCLDEEEEGTLVEYLMELVSMGGWKSNNGTIRPGYLAQLVCMMAEKLPGYQVCTTTVIDCRIKTLKRTFQAIVKMWGPACSDFG